MISVILLAAGLSKRMGNENKLLLQLGSTTIIEHTIEQYIKSDIDEIIVVVGYENNRIKQKLEKFKNLKIIFNPSYEKGMTTSIQAGISNANITTNGFMIGFTDMPFITSTQINQIIDKFKASYKNNSKTIVVPSFNKNEGHPIIFSSYYKEEILSHLNMSGLKEIKIRYRTNVISIEMNTEEFMFDIDTKEDYERFQKYFLV